MQRSQEEEYTLHLQDVAVFELEKNNRRIYKERQQKLYV